jgi:uncharacterized protein (DUF2141 family)
MKKIVLILLFICSKIVLISAQEKETFMLTVNISGLESNEGTLMVGIYNNKSDFLKTQLKGAIVKIKNKKSVVIFKNLTLGEYAISFIHDENNNNKIDTNIFGIPKEDYGCSNNAKSFIGPPKYDDAKFILTENKTIEIHI